MNEHVLRELASKWEREAKSPDCEDGSPQAALTNAKADGVRAGKRECAVSLRTLIAMLGD